MQEVWKDIKGYEECYQISNFSNVRSKDRRVINHQNGSTRYVRGMNLTPWDNGNGYLVISLNKGRKRKNYYVHRLVAEYFLEKHKNKEYVNHLDYNKHNNKYTNLEWCTQKDNVTYSRERMKKSRQITHSNTGHKYIYLRNNKYRVCVPQYLERCFGTLDEALEYKGVIMNERQK